MAKKSLFFQINAMFLHSLCLTRRIRSEHQLTYNTSLVNILLNPISTAPIICRYIFFMVEERT